MFFRQLLLLALCAGLSAPASAATIVSETLSYAVGGFLPDGERLDLNAFKADRNVPKSRNLSFDDGSEAMLKNAALWNQSNDQALKPDGLGRKDNYLAVMGAMYPHQKDNAAVFTLNGLYTTFSFLWGSIDSYNSLTIEDMKGERYTLTGAALLNANAALIQPGQTSTFSITDLDGIKRIIISSTCSAFELAKISVSNVPLPAALPLFAFALAGLAVARKKLSA